VDLAAMAKSIDDLFGFETIWTFRPGAGCCGNNGVVNIDQEELDWLYKAAGVADTQREPVTWFVMGHEKGHIVIENVFPDRDCLREERQIEIECDLMGAWVAARLSGGIETDEAKSAVSNFNDINYSSKGIGRAIGDPAGDHPRYPWPEQREMSIVRAKMLAALYKRLDQTTLAGFAQDLRDSAADRLEGL